MTENASTVQGIVNSNYSSLLEKMQQAHPDADVGISVALYYPGHPAVPGFFRYGSTGKDIEITAETVFGLGSVTKVFTAALAAYLAVEGMIGRLGETLVGPYLSNAACKPSGVTGP